MVRDCKLVAEKNNINFKFNSYFPIKSLNLMRGVFVADEDNFKSYYIDSIFNSIWQDGLNMNDEIIIQKVLKNLNINPKTFLLRTSSSAIKDLLKKYKLTKKKVAIEQVVYVMNLANKNGVKVVLAVDTP